MKLESPVTFTDQQQKQFVFDSTDALKDFLKSQANFWSSQTASPHSMPYVQKHTDFRNVANQITTWEPNFENWDLITFNANFRPMIDNFNRSSWLWSNHPFVKKWESLNQISTNMADAFFEAVVSNATSRYSQGFEFFQGYAIAYECLNQGKTDIRKIRNSEAKSLESLRTELVTKQIELISDVSGFQNDITQWKGESEDKIADLLINKEKCLDDTNEFHSKNFHAQLASWTNKHTELEKRFREELRFESVAVFWGKKVSNFARQGYWWCGALVVSILLGVGLFSKYFLTWLSGQPSGLGLQSIEGILIFAVILSSYAFLIKSLSKMTFSSFHLMRDAEEREQLTHLYLNLRDGKDDDPESRKIILQALFSRSDSGLLAGDHSPTMPSIQEVIRATGR